MAGTKVGPWDPRLLAKLKEEALASLDRLADGLWSGTRPHMHAEAENAVLQAKSWPEVAGALRSWENRQIRGRVEGERALDQVIARDLNLPRRQRRAEALL